MLAPSVVPESWWVVRSKPRTDGELIQIVDAAMAEAVRRSGSWVACRPGCFECCIGPFPITQLDAIRLQEGLAELASRDALRAERVRERAQESVARIRSQYPENPLGSVLSIDEAGADELCPALDPETHTCDLYSARPITCRTFGPAARFGAEFLAVCELCYQGASDAQIAACEVSVDSEEVEGELLSQLAARGRTGETIVAFALVEG